MIVLESMVAVYANLIKNGRRTLDSIPVGYQEAVKAAIEQ